MTDGKCKACGYDLTERLGVDSHVYQIDNGETCDNDVYGDIIGYYCPECGADVPTEQADYVHDKWEERNNGIDNVAKV